MIVLKIIFWIIIVILGLIVLTLLNITLALCPRVYADIDAGGPEGFRVSVKYGFFGLNVWPKLLTPEKIEKYKRIYKKLDYRFGKYVRKFALKAKDKIKKTIDIKKIEEELKEQEHLQQQESEKDNAAADALGGSTDAGAAEEKKFKNAFSKIKDFDFYEVYLALKAMKDDPKCDMITGFLRYLSHKTGKFTAKLKKHIIIKKLFVILTVHGKDSADTAMNYGKLCTVAFTALGKILTTFNVKKYDLEIDPDFLAVKDKGEIHFMIGFRPIVLVNILLGYFIGLWNKGKGAYGDFTKEFSKKQLEAEKLLSEQNTENS